MKIILYLAFITTLYCSPAQAGMDETTPTKSLSTTKQQEGFTISGTILFKKTETIHISLETKASFMHDDVKPQDTLILALSELQVETQQIPFAFKNIPPGIYAILCFQDVNNNGKIDLGLFGPKEPWDMHRRPGGFGPPRFDGIAFEVKANIKNIHLEL